jgi:hypothetical protein
VDDIPLLVAQQVHMGVPDLLDAFFPRHGNREGLRSGWLTTLWLCYVLSEADHHLTPLSELQTRILALLSVPVDPYTNLAAVSSQPP